MHNEPDKKKKGLRLVSKKSSKKMLGKWRKLSSDETDELEESLVEEAERAQRRVFGLRLSESVRADPSLDGIALPSFFRFAIDYIEENGLTTEGIYRLSPPKNRLDELERRANCVEPISFVDAHDAAGLIKRFLRQVPEPVLPNDFESIAESCTCGLASMAHLKHGLVCTCGAVETMREALKSVEIERKTLFSYMFLHAQHIMVKESENKMGLPGLGLLLQTVLEMSRKLVCFCAHTIRPFDGIEVEGACYLLQKDYRILKYVAPRHPEVLREWLADGSRDERQSAAEVRLELVKQQNWLELLHQKISQRHENGVGTRMLDEKAWQIQNGITMLKRKLKNLADDSPVPISTSVKIDRCIEMYEEKQLMAIQQMLKEDIGEEQKKIAMLCWKLNAIGKLGMEEDRGTVVDEEIDEKAKLEEAARATLLDEISRLRSTCALLRAQIEMESMRSM